VVCGYDRAEASAFPQGPGAMRIMVLNFDWGCIEVNGGITPFSDPCQSASRSTAERCGTSS
jgi:hypothetical protein